MNAPAWLVRWLARAAAFVRALAGWLERAAGGPDVSPATMQALAARFPGAPDHWLQVIAERAPHLAEAPPSEPVLPRGPPPPPLRPMAAGRRSQHSRRWGAEDEPPRGTDTREAPAAPPRTEQRVGAVFRAFSRRRRPMSAFPEPRRRAPGWSATFEPTPHVSAGPAPFDTAPTVPRRSAPEVEATAPSARLTPVWIGTPGAHSQRKRGEAGSPLSRWRMGEGSGMGVWAKRSSADAGGASRGFLSPPERALPSPALPPSADGTGEERGPPPPPYVAPSSRPAASFPTRDPPPRRRRTDVPADPPLNRWPALPPAATPEVEEADAASPRLRDLIFEQERGLWSG